MQETITLQDGTVVQVADFEFGFTFDKKALSTDEEDGTLTIEGYASDFDFDRQDEAFESGAFNKSLDEYMRTNPVLLYHHKYDTSLGTVKEAKIDGQGLWVKAIVDKPEPNTPVADYYRKIKSGVIRGFSVGGKFYRRMTDAGMRIFKCDLREISVTPMPVNPRTIFAVAGKAFEGMEDNKTITEDNTDIKALVERLDGIAATFDRLEANKTVKDLEGKSSQHPDGPSVAALQYHLQAIHTLATNMKQDAQSENTKSLADDVAKHAKMHLTKLHDVAKKVGPLPNSYGGTVL